MKIIARLDAGSLLQPVFGVASAVLMGVASAASHDGHREHEAHVHGHGTLDIVVEGEELVVELRIPSVNVVGFEHAPRTDAEREAVHQALVPFREAASVLVPSPEAECEVENVEARITAMADEEHDDHDGEHERHEEHGHEGDDDEHGSESAEHEAEHEEHEAGHEEHEHEAQEMDSDAEAHSELHAAYHFHCHAPERLDRIGVRVFEHLHDAEEIEVRLVTPSVQTAFELHPGDEVVEIAR